MIRGRIDPHAKYRELIAARLDKPLTRVELRTLDQSSEEMRGMPDGRCGLSLAAQSAAWSRRADSATRSVGAHIVRPRS